MDAELGRNHPGRLQFQVRSQNRRVECRTVLCSNCENLAALSRSANRHRRREKLPRRNLERSDWANHAGLRPQRRFFIFLFAWTTQEVAYYSPEEEQTLSFRISPFEVAHKKGTAAPRNVGFNLDIGGLCARMTAASSSPSGSAGSFLPQGKWFTCSEY